MTVPSDLTQLDYIYRCLEAEEMKLMKWFKDAIAIWTECMRARKAWMKEQLPPPDSGKGKKQYYPRTYNPFQFKPVNKDGDHECKLMLQPRRNGGSYDLPITKATYTTKKRRYEKFVRFAPELRAIVLALDEACIPIRRTDRLIRKLRHAELTLSHYWRRYNGLMPAARNRTTLSPKPSDVVQLALEGAG